MELDWNKKKLKHKWRIIEHQIFYRKYKGMMTACKPTIDADGKYYKFFDSYDEAYAYYKKKFGWDHWAETNKHTGDWHNAYYEAINDFSAIMKYTDCKNYRIFTWHIVDFYEDEEEFDSYSDVKRTY